MMRFVSDRNAPWIAAGVVLLLSLFFATLSDRSWASSALEAALVAIVVFLVVRSSRQG